MVEPPCHSCTAQGHLYKGPGRDNVARGDPIGRTLSLGGGTRRQLRLRKERISGRIFRKIVELEIRKRIVGSTTGLREVSDWRLWRGRPPPKRNKRRPKNSPGERTKMMMVHIDRLAPHQGSSRDEWPLERSSRSSWRVITTRSEPRGRKARSITDVTSTATKRRNGGTPVGYSERIALRREQCRM
jgi:hypothetical protein